MELRTSKKYFDIESFPVKEIENIGIDLNPQNFDFIFGYPSTDNLSFVENFDIRSFGTDKELGIYIHIPFCKSLCNYCYFSKTSDCSNELIEKYLSALNNEMIHYSKVLRNAKIKYCYVGGGTPSVLSLKQIDYLLQCLHRNFNFSNCIEFTFEGSPSTLTLEKINFLKFNGISRISIGVQSFNDKVSAAMNRDHNKFNSLDCIENLKNVFDKHFNIDLIYGYPLSDINILTQDIDLLEKIDLPSVTFYQLWSKVCASLYKNKPISFQNILTQKLLIQEFSFKFTYHQDKSDWFIKNEESKFKFQDYKWQNGNFIGLGISSYAFINNYYYTNTENISQYFNKIHSGTSIARIKHLTNSESILRRLILGLKIFTCHMSKSNFSDFTNILDKLEQNGIIESKDNLFCLSNIFKMIPDNVGSYLYKNLG